MCLSSSVKSLRILSPTAAACMKSWVRIFLLWVHSVASLQPEADGLQGLQNQHAFHNFSSAGLRKPLELARQDLRVVDEVVLLLISMFQQIRASRQSPIPGSSVNQGTASDAGEYPNIITDSTVSSGCSSCLIRWQ